MYNALKTMRKPEVHGAIWKDEGVKNIHYILSPKPWDAPDVDNGDALLSKWWNANNERLAKEREEGITDGF